MTLSLSNLGADARIFDLISEKNILFGFLVQQQRSKFFHVFIILTRGIYLTRAPMPGQWFTRKLAYPQKTEPHKSWLLTRVETRRQRVQLPLSFPLVGDSGSVGHWKSGIPVATVSLQDCNF